MQKSFKARLEALEALEAKAEQERAASEPAAVEWLDSSDCEMLRFQLSIGNIALTDGIVSRRWAPAGAEYATGLDTVLTRLNIILPMLESPVDTLDALDTWLIAEIEYIHVAWIEAIAQAIEMLDTDAIYVRAFDSARDIRQYDKQIQHMVWATGADSGLASDDTRHDWIRFIRGLLDGAQQQSGGTFCQSTAEARAVLVQLLEEQTNEQFV